MMRSKQLLALLVHLLAAGMASDGPARGVASAADAVEAKGSHARYPTGGAPAADGYHRRRTIHYDVGATYSFDFELFVHSDGLGAAINAARQNERMDARCDVTARVQNSDAGWLLELEVSEMHQSSVHQDGSVHPVPTMGDDRLGRHAFYFLQDRDGAISSVYYPAQEVQDVANLKKGTPALPFSSISSSLCVSYFPSMLTVVCTRAQGLAGMFHTRAGRDDGETSIVEEHDEHGNHTVRYEYELRPDKQVVRRHREHEIMRFVDSSTHGRNSGARLNVMDDSDVTDVTEHHLVRLSLLQHRNAVIPLVDIVHNYTGGCLLAGAQRRVTWGRSDAHIPYGPQQAVLCESIEGARVKIQAPSACECNAHAEASKRDARSG